MGWFGAEWLGEKGGAKKDARRGRAGAWSVLSMWGQMGWLEGGFHRRRKARLLVEENNS